jgi:hypothetical protein
MRLRGPLERFTSLLVSALLRLGVEPQEAARLGRGAAQIIAQHASGVRFQLSPGRRRDPQMAARAARLRADGLSYSAIGDALDCSTATAYRLAQAGAPFVSPVMSETRGALASAEPLDAVPHGCN